MTALGDTALYLVIAGVAATAVWRVAGALLATGISDDGAIITWVKSVSMALVAGLISRIIFFPPGALADVSLTVRTVAFAIGVAVFLLMRWNMGFGILAGTSALMALHSLQI
jgi:hypothetical protein